MTDREAMIAACTAIFDEESKTWIDTRNDDLPRQAFADWCEENNDPERAEFVRVQCELEKLGRIENDSLSLAWGPSAETYNSRILKARELRSRERELRHGGGKREYGEWGVNEWNWGVKDIAGWTDSHGWSRGFISRIRCSWADWLAHHERLYWSPEQTVECSRCRGDGQYRGKRGWSEGTCRGECKGTGRIPRPTVIEVPCPNKCGWDSAFKHRSYRSAVGWLICDQCNGGTISQSVWETCQPLEWVELTAWPEDSIHFGQPLSPMCVAITQDGYRFDRVKCPKCVRLQQHLSSHPEDNEARRLHEQCPLCHGQPLNEWTCDAWGSRLKFRMPERP